MLYNNYILIYRSSIFLNLLKIFRRSNDIKLKKFKGYIFNLEDVSFFFYPKGVITYDHSM